MWRAQQRWPCAVAVACALVAPLTTRAGSDCPSFLAPFAVVDTGRIPVDLIGADLDGDGRDEFIAANYYTQSVTVLSADLSRLDEFSVRNGPRALAVGDVDGDSRLDIVVACLGRVSVRRNMGNGAFENWPDLWTEVTVVQVAAGDFDADGIADIVTLRLLGDGSNRIELWHGAGDGTFAAAQHLVVPGRPEAFAAARLDAGPTLDLVIGTTAGLVLWFGGAAEPAAVRPLAGTASMIAARDGVGAAVSYQANVFGSPIQHVQWIQVDAQGGVTFEADAVVPEYIFDLAIVDIDGDAVEDVLALGARLQPLRRRGMVFEYGRPADAGAIASAVAGSDVDGDGHLDAVIADAATTGVLVATGRGIDWFGHSPLFTTTLPQAAQLHDLDGDGHLDALFVGALFGQVAVHRGTGTGAFGQRTDVATLPWAVDAALADFDGDGLLDLAVVSHENFRDPLVGRLALHRGNGHGGFGAAQSITDLAGPATGVCAADWDGDGRQDLAVSVWDHRFPADGGVAVFRGNGDLSLAPAVMLAVGPLPMGIATGDLDADGRLDLVATFRQFSYEARGGVTWWRGAAGGTFTGRVDVPTGIDPRHLVIARVDADDRPDVVVANSNFARPAPGQLVVLRSDGNALTKTADVTCARETFAPVVGDFDGDGMADVAVTNSGTHTIHLWRGDGTGALFGGCEIGSGPRPVGIAAGDLNEDGRLDLVTADAGGASATVILHAGGQTPVLLAAFSARRTPGSAVLEWSLAAPNAVAWVQVERSPGFDAEFGAISTRLVPAASMRYEDSGAPESALYRLRVGTHAGGTWTSAPVSADLRAVLDLAPPILAPEGIRLSWTLPHSTGRARVQIVDARGRRVRDVADGAAPAGTHAAVWDRRDEFGHTVARGVYWATLDADGRRISRRVLAIGR